jgi:hypothetical protein
MRNILDKICIENKKTHNLCSIYFSLKSCRLWDNVEKYGKARGAKKDVTIWRIRVACLINKATRNSHGSHAHAPGHPRGGGGGGGGRGPRARPHPHRARHKKKI